MSRPRRPGTPTLGPLPLAGLLVVEIGLAGALVLVVLEPGLLPVAGLVVSAALVAGLVRVRGELLATWIGLGLRHRLRPRELPAPESAATALALGALDALLGAVTVVDDRDHDGRGLALLGGDDGAWSAVLVPDEEELPLLLGDRSRGAVEVPLTALAGTLRDRGVVLDAVTVVRHLRPPPAPASRAAAAHRQVLGPLADAAHRSTWLVVRLDPQRCPGAVAERGGGGLGARRALVGALARIGRVLDEHGLPVRPLDRAGVRDAVAVAGALDLDRAPGPVAERWDAVVAGEVGHATWAVTGMSAEPLDLDHLAVPGAPTTVAWTLGPDGEDGPDGALAVGFRVRVSAGAPQVLVAAGRELADTAGPLGLRVEPQHGRQGDGLLATLPLGVAGARGAA